MSRRLERPELAAVEVTGTTRAAFLLRGALAVGAVYGTGAVAPFVERALAQTSQSDIQILSFAAGLEALESAFYANALKGKGVPGNAKKIVTEIASHEQQHLQTLTQTVQALGGQSPATPKPKKTAGSFLKTAVALEEVGVGAYNGAAPSIKSPDLLQVAGAIVQVEARHAAALRELAAQDPAPNAFDKALTPTQAAAAVKPFSGG